MLKHEACAAANSSSGLLAGSSPKREATETLASRSAPLAVEAVPEEPAPEAVEPLPEEALPDAAEGVQEPETIIPDLAPQQ